jgi:hypothetical protein
MGNALVVGVIEQMGRRLMDLVNEADQNGERRIRCRKPGGTIIGPLDRCDLSKIDDCGE